MNNSILTMETNKYAIKIENFEGPLDLLCHLIDKNKMDIKDIKIDEITDQYIEYINKMEQMNLEITSEFIIMASTLLYLKSKSLLPVENNEEEEITEEELIRRIIEYKKYKEIIKNLKENYSYYSKCFYKKNAETIELPKQKLEKEYDNKIIPDIYKKVVARNANRLNKNAKNIEKIAIVDTYTVAEKVKEMFKELVRSRRFIFNKLFSIQKCNKNEVVTAFSGLLEMSRRNKIITQQQEIFGDITVSKKKQNKINM